MSLIKGVIVKTTAPTVNDDNTKGFYQGFNWVLNSGGTLKTYQCTDASTGAAVWNVTSSNDGAADSCAYTVGRNNTSITTSQDLRTAGNVPTNQTPFIVPKAGTIFGISAAHSGSPVGKNWTARILVNGVGVANLVLNGVAKNQDDTLGVAVAQGDEIRLTYLYRRNYSTTYYFSIFKI